MYKVLKFFMLFLLIIVPQISWANLYDRPAKIEDFIEILPEAKTVFCKFEQTKYLKNIERPIVSGGNFRFVENEGVYFETIYPIKATASYTNREYKQINDIILAISHKKYSKLNKDFDYFFDNNNQSWQLGLKPKEDCPASNYIVSVTVEGQEYIQKIILRFKNGSYTTICFSDFQTK